MLKAVTGFTLPDNVRVEANTEVPEDFASESIMFRLRQKGVLIPIVEQEDPVPEAVEDADASSTPEPTTTTKKRPKAVSGSQDVEEQA